MKNILITTTNQIENATIEKYLELVSTNVVLGTNIFSDLAASLSDVFGGYSESYQNKLQKIYNVAIKNIKDKAARLGGNAIIGFKIDFDEISGDGKSMFMVSAIGMAVIISNNKAKQPNDSFYIDDSELEDELMKLEITHTIDDGNYLDNEQWLYVLNNPCDYFAENLLKQYIELISSNEFEIVETQELLVNNINTLLSRSDTDKMSSILYESIDLMPEKIYEKIRENKLFSPKLTLQLLENNKLHEAIVLLEASKRQYNAEDLEIMRKICDFFDKLPDIGKFEEVKSLIGRATDKYICPNGHINNPDEEFCVRGDCCLNIKGIELDELYIINRFKDKVEALSNLLKAN